MVDDMRSDSQNDFTGLEIGVVLRVRGRHARASDKASFGRRHQSRFRYTARELVTSAHPPTSIMQATTSEMQGLKDHKFN